MIYGFGDCLRFRILLLVCAFAVNSVGMVVLVILGCISLLLYLYLPISGLCRLWLFGVVVLAWFCWSWFIARFALFVGLFGLFVLFVIVVYFVAFWVFGGGCLLLVWFACC